MLEKMREAFQKAGIRHSVIARELKVSRSYICMFFGGQKLTLKLAKRVWSVLPNEYRTEEVAVDTVYSIMKNNDLMNVCDINPERALAYFNRNEEIDGLLEQI